MNRTTVPEYSQTRVLSAVIHTQILHRRRRGSTRDICGVGPGTNIAVSAAGVRRMPDSQVHVSSRDQCSLQKRDQSFYDLSKLDSPSGTRFRVRGGPEPHSGFVGLTGADVNTDRKY